MREEPNNLDEAIRLFKDYCQGEGDFDELDFKEYITEVWLYEKFREKSRIKHGFNSDGTMG